jgi:2-amino-4-hydroxy-6-hydroxymethyldihydropteridine diphosphokinase
VSAALGYIGLGSNLGDRRAMLKAAVEDFWAHGVQAIASSSVYETEPVGEVLDQPALLNACVRIETALGPEALLDACKAVEAALGRASGGVRHGPRPVDADVLLLGDEAYASERLEIPHRELARRRFVLVPLLELDPGLRLPDGTSLAGALAALKGQVVRRAGPPLDVRA